MSSEISHCAKRQNVVRQTKKVNSTSGFSQPKTPKNPIFTYPQTEYLKFETPNKHLKYMAKKNGIGTEEPLEKQLWKSADKRKHSANPIFLTSKTPLTFGQTKKLCPITIKNERQCWLW